MIYDFAGQISRARVSRLECVFIAAKMVFSKKYLKIFIDCFG